MSSIERNKGKLIPVVNNPTLDYADWDTLYNLGYVRVKNIVYSVEWEVEGEGDCSYFADVKVNPDGSIDFHTLHYNGGGFWTEIIEDKLK